MYKVIQRFVDGEKGKPFPKGQGGAVYEVGDTYPAKGFKPTEAHIKYLLNCNFNRKGAVIAVEGIEKVGE